MKMPAFVKNLMTTRTSWLNKLMDQRRDIDAECGHPAEIAIADYSRLYERGDVARRIVNIYPEESWSEHPEVVQNENEDESEFEATWKELEDEFKIFSYLQRADVLSGIGRFGVLLLGFDDGKNLNEAVEGTGRKLLYLRPFEEELVDISTLESDISNPRFGQPLVYNIRFEDVATTTGQTATAKAEAVHWTRIIHLADNRQNSDVYGTPRMKSVFNRLLDLRKIAGGSGEMFWKGGFPGLSLEAANPDEDVEFDAEATQEQMDKYSNGLQRYISLVGMTAKSLAPQVANPMPHVEVQLKLIAAAMAVPWRLFMGSEAAQLASGQDTVTWNRRINRRRVEYINAFIIRPLIERLMEFGVLPTVDEYDIKWKDLNSPGDEEKANVADKITGALSKYVQSGLDALIPPFQYLTLVLDFTDEEAKGILEEAGDRIEELTPEFVDERDAKKAEDGLERDMKREAAKKPVVVAPGTPPSNGPR